MTIAPTTPRWLHAWAVLTALLTVPLLFFGAEVTTKKVGMVDPIWPTSPVYLLVEGTAWEKGIGFLIEHWHRLAGWTVGTCVIVLAIGLWLKEPRRWVRLLGWMALAAIINQGLLGGFRVRLNALLGTELALIHGCFGQLVFALLVSLALCTSRHWSQFGEISAVPAATSALRRGTLLVTGLLVIQLILGAILRHKGSALGQRGHLLAAFAVVGALAWLTQFVRNQFAEDRNLQWGVRCLAVLLVLQLLLGVEAWMVRFATPELLTPGHWLWNRDLVRTGHVLIGSCLLATALVLTLEAHRRSLGKRNLDGEGEAPAEPFNPGRYSSTEASSSPVPASASKLEGAA